MSIQGNTLSEHLNFMLLIFFNCSKYTDSLISVDLHVYSVIHTLIIFKKYIQNRCTNLLKCNSGGFDLHLCRC